MTASMGIDVIRSVQGASRYARSYAFLYAAFQKNRSDSPAVKDAVDCLIPFITAYTNGIIGQQVRSQDIQTFLRANFGFEIPIYAIERALPDLQKAGFIEYQAGTRIWIAKPKENSFAITKEEIDTDFDEIVSFLEIYATKVGFDAPPPSGDWGLAIISFLKPDTAPTSRSTLNLKGAIIDSRETERKLVASFIQQLWESQPTRYEKVVKIFMRVLIEDFLSGISEFSGIEKTLPLVVFYDTAILLRLLGTSGTLQKTAAGELTRYLQDIGCDLRFLPGNEAEVNNVITTILNVADSGGELEGETADAISRGEVHISDLRMLQNNFVERLAQLNVFEYQEAPISQDIRQFQINEAGFARYLNDQAIRRGKSYGLQNRQNDAGYLGAVMRLRRGTKVRDFAKSRFVFVTPNNMLSYISREYLIAEGQLTGAQCGPILHVTQVATIAWLIKDQKLSSDLAARELLVNCYAAAQPNAEWFKFFRQGIEQAVGNMEAFAKEPDHSSVLQAARRIAQEQSFSNASVLRQLNAAEIIDEARRISESREKELVEKSLLRQQEIITEFATEKEMILLKHGADLIAHEEKIRIKAKEDALTNTNPE